MLEREKYLEALREEAQLASDEDGEDLEIIDNDDGDEQEENEEGKANAPVASPTATPIPDVPPPTSAAARKRRRPAIDPFAGLCGSHLFMCFLLSHHSSSLSQVMAMVQIPRPILLQQRPLRLILHQALRVLAGRFEEPVKRTSALMPRVERSTRTRWKKSQRNDLEKRRPHDRSRR